MSATTVVAEILVVGLQAEVWVALLILALHDGASLAGLAEHLKGMKEWATLGTTVVLGMAYGLGVIVDRWADTLLFWQDRDQPHDTGVMRLTVMDKSERMARFLDYQRSRLRVVRGTVVNVLLITVSAALYCVTRRSGAGLGWVLVAGILALLVTGYAATRIKKAFFDRLGEAYKIAKAA